MANATMLKRFLSGSLKTRLVSYLPHDRYMRHVWAKAAPFPGIEEKSTYVSRLDVRLGILKSYNLWHQYYAAACRELNVAYSMIDITRTDWIDQIRSSGCDAFLVWPTPSLSVWKQLYDERLATLAGPLGRLVYPDIQAMWIYESKRRMHYWLAANGFPHPETWIFYDREQALDFAESAQVPIVTKTDLGAESTGVRIVRTRQQLRRIVRQAFGSGILRRGADRRDREWNTVFFQRFIPHASEWRIIRIGDSYFGYEKIRIGQFHSGTAQWRYIRPPEKLLNLTRDITERGQFTSMSVDILLDESGNFFINELQGVFGMLNDYACMVDGKIGRMTTGDGGEKNWVFEEGEFCRNRMCNLRVQVVLDMLRRNASGSSPNLNTGRVLQENARQGLTVTL